MRWIPLAIGVALLAACHSEPSDPTETSDAPNVTVLVGAQVVVTDTAVLIGAGRRIDFGDGPFGIISDHFTEFTYGGLYETINDALVDESWYMDVGRRIVTDVRGDTVFTRALDFGDVALQGMAANRYASDSALMVDTGDGVLVYENLLLNRLHIYAHRINVDGSTVTFAHAPFYESMVAGGEVELTASGSDEIAPTSASLTLDAGARVTALWNGEYLAFGQQRPVLRSDQPLIVELDRSLDPDRTVLFLIYAPAPTHDVDPASVRRARAVFMLTERTNRVVIPASALAEIASHLPVSEDGFIFRIHEYGVMEDVLEIVRLGDGITELLSGIQKNGFGWYVWMRR
jgi:hypothetical protein